MTRQRLSVGFADLTHYAKAVETLGSERALEILQEMFVAAGDIIVRYGGQIRKYIGDTILFAFTDPHAAVLAATEIASTCRREIGSLVMQYHVGVATGEVLICKIGHPSYVVDDIMGETVNRAAILSKAASKNESGVALCDETNKYE